MQKSLKKRKEKGDIYVSNNYLFDNISQNELNSLYLEHKEPYQELRKKLKLSNESARLKFLSNLDGDLKTDIDLANEG